MDRARAWHSLNIDLSVEPLLRIGEATIDPVSREAEYQAGRERLQPQNLKVLVALARRRGQVVSRVDLIDLCWDGRIVGEDVINHAISVLRGFAERAGGFTIETVPKAGYRMQEEARVGLPSKRGWPMFGLAGLALVAATAALALVATRAEKQSEPPVPTVALVPMGVPAGDAAAAEVARAARVSLSHMLADGGFPIRLTDSADRSSDFVITGDVERSSGIIRASVRIQETRHQTVIFTQRYEAGEREAADLADQIGASVAANLTWTGGLMILDRRRPSDPALTGELLRQMSLIVEGGDTLRAYEISKSIAGKAPDSAIAQLTLAFNTGFALDQIPVEQRAGAVLAARRASEKALELAPEFGDSYIPWCLLHAPVRRLECERRLGQAMKLDPEAPFANWFLASLLRNVGRFDDSLKLARMSIAQNPYRPAKLLLMISALEVAGRAEEADALHAKAVRWWPDHRGIAWGRIIGLIEGGNFDALEQFVARDSSRPNWATGPVTALRAGDPAQAKRICSAADPHPFAPLLCLVVLAQLGELDAAFTKAAELYPPMRGRSPVEDEKLWLAQPVRYPASLISAPSTAPLRRDERFLEIADRLGLRDYWRGGALPDFCRKPAEPVCSRLTRG